MDIRVVDSPYGKMLRAEFPLHVRDYHDSVFCGRPYIVFRCYREDNLIYLSILDEDDYEATLVIKVDSEKLSEVSHEILNQLIDISKGYHDILDVPKLLNIRYY